MKLKRWLVVLVIAGGLAGGIGYGLVSRGSRTKIRDVQKASRARATSPYLNTRAEAQYVGAARCAECHEGQHQSYLGTAHAAALADIDLAQEPPDGGFDHAKSGRRYKVFRRDDKLWHRESHLRTDGTEVELDELPVRYVVGSGHFARTYLVERDGYLIESPITWFGKRQAWGMSPGYDDSEHSSFHRLIVPECLHCHMGTFETDATSRYRFEFREHAIGCERCHGPGSLHAERYARGDKPAKGEDDLTIVNPRKLARELSEAICSDCHLSGKASARARGVALGEFRPGLPLEDFRHEYRFDAPHSQMTVTGHVEQLHLSKCYSESESLTCITCHDPHHSPQPDERVAYNRAACLKCHAAGDEDTCKAPRAERLAAPIHNDCIRCHMPQVPTDLLHFAFTHHRIGIHSGDQERKPEPVGSALVPLDDLSHLSQADWDRSRGLAYYDLYSKEAPFDPRYAVYLDRAQELLESAYGAGVTDADVAAALALISGDRGDWNQAIEWGKRVLKQDSPQTSRDDALFAIAQACYQTRRYHEAIEALKKLTEVRWSAHEWYLLGTCQQQLGHMDEAIAAFEQAARIDPGVGLTHRTLAPLYEQRGDRQRAQFHSRRGQQLPESGFPATGNRPR